MLNKIWPLFIIISFFFAIIFGKLPEINHSIFESLESAVNLTLTLIGTMCLWCGMMKIVMQTNLINKLINILKPVLRCLFPEIREEDEVHKEISMNIMANLLGLGNAATPFGLKAIKSLQKHNIQKESLSNSMVMLIVLNTASIQIIPTTVIAIRTSLGSKDPVQMIFPIWIATICAAMAAIITTKLLIKSGRY